MCKLTIISDSDAKMEVTGAVAESYAEELHRMYGFNAGETGQVVVVTDLVTTVTDSDGNVSIQL